MPLRRLKVKWKMVSDEGCCEPVTVGWVWSRKKERTWDSKLAPTRKRIGHLLDEMTTLYIRMKRTDRQTRQAPDRFHPFRMICTPKILSTLLAYSAAYFCFAFAIKKKDFFLADGIRCFPLNNNIIGDNILNNSQHPQAFGLFIAHVKKCSQIFSK